MVHAATPVNNWCVLLRYLKLIFPIYVFVNIHTYILIIINRLYILLYMGNQFIVVGLFLCLFGHPSLMWFRLKGCATILALLVWTCSTRSLGSILRLVSPRDIFCFCKFFFPNSQSEPRCVRLGVGGCVSTSLGFLSLFASVVSILPFLLLLAGQVSGFWFSCIRLHNSLLACLLIVAQTTCYFCFLSLLHMTIMWCSMLAHVVAQHSLSSIKRLWVYWI